MLRAGSAACGSLAGTDWPAGAARATARGRHCPGLRRASLRHRPQPLKFAERWADMVNEAYPLASREASSRYIAPSFRPVPYKRACMTAKPVAIIMGSQSDWPTMRHAAETLDALGVGYDKRIVSAHRTPDRLYAFAKGAKADGLKVIIAGAGGAAHLPGMTAVDDHAAGVRRAGRIEGAVRRRFALFHRADAAGRAGRHARDRQVRRDQCGAARRERAGAVRRGAGEAAGGAGASSRPTRWRSARRTRRDPATLAARARRHHRHPRRRAARPHAGAGRGAARIQVPRVLSGSAFARRSMWCAA